MKHALKLQLLTLLAILSYPSMEWEGQISSETKETNLVFLEAYTLTCLSLSRKHGSHFTSSYKNILSLLTFPISLF